MTSSHPTRGRGGGGAALCLLTSKDMRKWNEAVSGLDIRKSFFIQRVGHWNRLSQESGHCAMPVKSSKGIRTMLLVIWFIYR